MNLLFTTQGNHALFYLDLIPKLQKELKIEKIGFYITNRSEEPHYLKSAREKNLEITFLKGWELFDLNEKIDWDYIQKVEKEYGEPSLWNALIMDRRVFNGLYTKHKQDYPPRFSHEEMLLLIQNHFRAILKLFDDIKPDIVVGGFTPITLAEYIFYLCAKRKGIRYINLNPTKILNFVTFSNEIYREFPHIQKDFKKRFEENVQDEAFLKAENYIKRQFRKYEGLGKGKSSFRKWIFSLAKWPYVMGRYFLKKDYKDNLVRGYALGYFYTNILNPLKELWTKLFFPFMAAKNLEKVSFAYYPLHIEPEIALSLFGREHLNQIELIRNIAKSLPVTWKLVVKDHPAGVGRRNLGYYKRLLEIPNVVLVNPNESSEALIEKSKFVFTISGFAGFEAILKQKPVITFGKTFYNQVSSGMVRNVSDLSRLAIEVQSLIDQYQFSLKEITHLIAAIIGNSVPLNLYSDILKKKGRVSVGSDLVEDSVEKFAAFFIQKLKGVPVSSKDYKKIVFNYAEQPKEESPFCNICGSKEALPIADKDRYGFQVSAKLCLRCGLVYLSPRMKPEGYQLFYQKYYRPLVSQYLKQPIDHVTIQKGQADYAKEVFGWLRPQLNLKDNIKILDVGGSTGIVSKTFVQEFQRMGKSAEATVIDPSPQELEVAKGFGLKTKKGFVESVDFGKEKWNLILLCQTIDHLLDAKKTLKAIRETLTEDGYFFIDIVDWEHVVRKKSLRDAIKIDHPFNFTKEMTAPFLKRLGFEVLQEKVLTDGHLVGYLCRKSEPVACEFSQEHVQHLLNLTQKKKAVVL